MLLALLRLPHFSGERFLRGDYIEPVTGLPGCEGCHVVGSELEPNGSNKASIE